MKMKRIRKYFDDKKAKSCTTCRDRNTSHHYRGCKHTAEGDYYRIGNSNICYKGEAPDRVMVFLTIFRYTVEVICITIGVVWFFGFMNVELSKIYSQLSQQSEQTLIEVSNVIFMLVMMFTLTVTPIAYYMMNFNRKNFLLKSLLLVAGLISVTLVFPLLTPSNKVVLVAVLVGGSVLKRLAWILELVAVVYFTKNGWRPSPEDYVFSIEEDIDYLAYYPGDDIEKTAVKGWTVEVKKNRDIEHTFINSEKEELNNESSKKE